MAGPFDCLLHDGLLLADPVAAAVAAAAGLTWTTLDLGDGTETDTAGVKDASSVLGKTSTLVAANAHGNWDGGVDGYSNLTELLSTFDTSYGSLMLWLTGNIAVTGPSAGAAHIGLMVSPDGVPANGEGYYSDIIINTSNQFRARTTERIGTGTTAAVTLTGTKFDMLMVCSLGASKVEEATGTTWGDSGGRKCSSESTDAGGTWGALWGGLQMGQDGSSPGTVTFSGLQLAWTGLQRPAFG
jgi:hypothetical protein